MHLAHKFFVEQKKYFHDDEDLYLAEAGAYRHFWQPSWRLGHLCLTSQRLLIFQSNILSLVIPLNDIVNISLEKRPFVLGKRTVLAVNYYSPQKKAATKIWLLAKRLAMWQQKIYERTLLRVDENIANQISHHLDETSQRIFWHFWHKGRADLDELAKLSCRLSHREIEESLQNINTWAQKITGGSILFFEESKVDQYTGEKVYFNWWFLNRATENQNSREPMVDIFDEGNYLRIILDVSGLDDEVDFGLQEDALTLISGKDARLERAFPLPTKVKLDSQITKESSYNTYEIIVDKLIS